MIRSRNPKIDVAALEAKVAEELARDPQVRGSERLVRLAAAVHMRTIESALDHAEQRSEPRSSWPADITLFPFKGNTRLQRFVLWLMALAFRDQHDVNAQLIRAQRETLGLVSGLLDRIETLEARLEAERTNARMERLARRRESD